MNVWSINIEGVAVVTANERLMWVLSDTGGVGDADCDNGSADIRELKVEITNC